MFVFSSLSGNRCLSLNELSLSNDVWDDIVRKKSYAMLLLLISIAPRRHDHEILHGYRVSSSTSEKVMVRLVILFGVGFAEQGLNLITVLSIFPLLLKGTSAATYI